MKIIKVQKYSTQFKIFFDNGLEVIIPFKPTTKYYTITKEYLDGGGIIEEEFSESEIILNSTNETKTSLMTLCDKKQDEVQRLVLGYKSTPMQLDRYKDKYERAKANEWDQATNDLIILNHEAYLKAMRDLVDLIEHFRSLTDDLIIAGNLNKANEVIASAESFDETTTLADIDSLFIGVE